MVKKDSKKEAAPKKEEAAPVTEAEDAVPEGKRYVWRHGEKGLEDA